jgi:hypothetical protein
MNLQQFLGMSGSRPVRPDANWPLYRYRCTAAEYAQLRGVLSQRLASQDFRALSDDQCALLCLYLAEWWRREHDEGAWSWYGGLLSLGVTYGASVYQPLIDAVDRGLGRWRRPLIVNAGGRQFLITLACEGGLPLKLIRRASHLQRWFRSILEHLEAMGMTGDEPDEALVDLARRNEWCVPASLQQEVARALVGRLVGRVWYIRRQLGPPPAEGLIEHLDHSRPGWREELPLLVEDETAEALVRGLVSVADEVASGQVVREPGFLTWLERVGPDFRLSRQLDFPASMPEASLTALFQQEQLPRRMLASIQSADEAGRRSQAGVIRLHADGKWRLERYSGGGRLISEGAALRLALSRGDALLVTGDLQGAGALDGEMPWVFRPRDDRWVMVAQGSASRREPELLVAAPAGAVVEGGERLGDILDMGRTVYRVSRACTVQGDEEHWTIRAGSDRDESMTCWLAGARYTGAADLGEVWRGPPALRVLRAGGGSSRIGAEQLEFKQVGRPWQPLDRAAGGRGLVRWREDGETRFRESVRIVPAAFAVKLTAGTGRQPGRVEVTGALRAGVPEGPGYTLTRLSDTSLEIRVEDPAQATTRLKLTAQLEGGGELAMEIPLPVRRAWFESVEGTLLEHRTELHISELGGVMARCLTPSADAEVRLRARLVDTPVEGGQAYFETHVPLRKVSDGFFSLDLRDARERIGDLLGATGDPDASVRLSMFTKGGVGRDRELIVRRYDRRFGRDTAAGTVHIEGAHEPDDAVMMVERRRLAWLDQEPPEFMGTDFPEVGVCWLFEPGERAPGAWLITARSLTGWHRIRPMLWTVGPTALPETELRAAIEGPWFAGERLRKCAAALEALCARPDHPDWPLLLAFLGLLGDLPPSTFDVIRAFAMHPAAAAHAALRVPLEEVDVLREELSQLPFLWETVPVSAWEVAIDQHWSPLAAAVDPSLHHLLVNGLEQRLADFPVNARLAWARWRLGRALPVAPGENPAVYSRAMCLQAREEQLKGLLQRHDSETWPSLGGPELESEVQALLKLDPGLTPGHRGAAFRSWVLNAPVVAALASRHGRTLSPQLNFHLKEVRWFDDAWFEQALFFTFLAA